MVRWVWPQAHRSQGIGGIEATAGFRLGQYLKTLISPQQNCFAIIEVTIILPYLGAERTG